MRRQNSLRWPSPQLSPPSPPPIPPFQKCTALKSGRRRRRRIRHHHQRGPGGSPLFLRAEERGFFATVVEGRWPREPARERLARSALPPRAPLSLVAVSNAGASSFSSPRRRRRRRARLATSSTRPSPQFRGSALRRRRCNAR